MFAFVRPSELAEYMGRKDVLIVDVRDRESYEQQHIIGSVNIPVELIMKNRYRANRGKQFLLYCDKGNLSLKAALKLDRDGYNVLSLFGGIYGIKSYYDN